MKDNEEGGFDFDDGDGGGGGGGNSPQGAEGGEGSVGSNGVRAGGKRILCNKLIANVMKGNTYCTSERILIDTVHSVFNETEILEARKIIYEIFPVADSKGLDMGAKERRHHLKGHCEDVVAKVLEACKIEHNVIFCLPWDATFHEFISEDEKVAREVIKQGDREIDTKFADLEKKIDDKNKATIEAVKLMCDRVINSTAKSTTGAHPPSPLSVPAPELGPYARIVSGGSRAPANPGLLSGRQGETAARFHGNRNSGNRENIRDRSRSASKRPRLEDQPPGTQDPAHDDGAPPVTPGWNQAGGRKGHRAQKFVVGSGVRDSAGAARRMKTARSDVFIYAVDPDTTVEDIIEDLAFSQVEVSAPNVVKKTRVGYTGLDCYRISVKREDLEKALKPDTWPAGVRVREWVHYPARRPGQDGGQGQHGVGRDAQAQNGQHNG